MLSKRTVHSVGRFLNFVNSCGMLPFQWSEKKEKLKLPKSNAAYVLLTINRNAKEIITCYNMYISFFTKNGRTKMTRDKSDFLLDKFASFMTIASLTTSVTICSLALVDPHNPRYFYGGLPNSLRLQPIFVILFIIEVELLQLSVCTVFVVYLFALSYCLGISMMLKELNKHHSKLLTNKFNRFKIAFRRTRESVNAYKQLMIINSMFKECFTFLLVNSLSTILICHILVIYIAVKLHSDMPVISLAPFAFWSVGVLPMEIIYVFVMAQVFECSKKVIKNLERRVLPQERRYARLLPFGLKLAGNIKRNTPLLVVMIVFRMSRSLLIIF
ncbi:unnamed protein product [Allacma fusca]|uniref:Uncharacterized protein n=1 Tax=Allacma fusca TaxID=39272 RepID=A0A8J2P0W5_9HEXA|nr:unnamed protein product [Allacma fusca]